jgi:hypothetical protein
MDTISVAMPTRLLASPDSPLQSVGVSTRTKTQASASILAQLRKANDDICDIRQAEQMQGTVDCSLSLAKGHAGRKLEIGCKCDSLTHSGFGRQHMELLDVAWATSVSNTAVQGKVIATANLTA